MKDFNFRQEPKYTHLNMQELKSKKLVNPVVFSRSDRSDNKIMADSIQRYLKGESPSAIALSYQINSTIVYYWVKQYKAGKFIISEME